MIRFRPQLACLLLAGVSAPAIGQSTDIAALRAELATARRDLAEQQARLQQQEDRLRSLEARLGSASVATPTQAPGQALAVGDPAAPDRTAEASATGEQLTPTTRVERVGQAPPQFEDMPQVAILGEQGSVITRAGQISGELGFEYARADRNRAIFRGIEVVESVLVGVFDINESRQNVLTASGLLRYGITDRFEVGVRVPFVRRTDASVLTPVQGSTNDDAAATIDSSAKGTGIGDIELSARYQLTRAAPDSPFVIANIQAVLPTGSDPFAVPRDDTGRALKAATGSGFYGITPGLTAILPTDPAVLFGSVAYTFNLPQNVNTTIPPVLISRVDPGDSISASAGIGIALNQRTSFNLGYAHTWAFGTQTTTALIGPPDMVGVETTSTSRDLQIGRLLFGVTYRVTDTTSLNWSVELAATDDATDLRTVLRIPFQLFAGR